MYIIFLYYILIFAPQMLVSFTAKKTNWYMKYGSHEYVLQHNIKNINVITTQDSILYPNLQLLDLELI